MARETQGSPAGEKKLEQYGVWVKVKPREVTEAPLREDVFELSDLDSPRAATGTAVAETEDSSLTAEEEQLLDDLETELAPESTDASVPAEAPLLDDSELPEIDSVTGRGTGPGIAFGQETEEELPELEDDLERGTRFPRSRSAAATGEVEVTLSDDIPEEDRFDDLEALENELASVKASRPDSSTSSAQILTRIEEELRSIRTDLTQLRGELSGLRKAAGESTSRGPDADQDAQGGFFDEDEDETIALTGDELDNILNTADITEGSAEAPAAEVGTDEPASAPTEDILSYDTPLLDETPGSGAAEAVLEPLEEDLTLEDSLGLSLEVPAADSENADEADALQLEELPAELVLDELVAEADAAAASDQSAELPEVDLEAFPEIAAEPGAAAAETLPGTDGETIDLETLDLGEEPRVVEAVPERIDDLELLPELEEVPEAEAVLEEEPASESGGLDVLSDEVDLEALAAEAEALESETTGVPAVDDLEIGELEALTEESSSAPAAEKEIEIAFEAEEEPAVLESAEPDDQTALEDVLGAEEQPIAPGAAAPGIPDNLKDEIRTVLKYMDHLLEALPDEKIQEFASSDYFVMYKKLFEDLGLGE